jgi:hypothetical protein
MHSAASRDTASSSYKHYEVPLLLSPILPWFPMDHTIDILHGGEDYVQQFSTTLPDVIALDEEFISESSEIDRQISSLSLAAAVFDVVFSFALNSMLAARRGSSLEGGQFDSQQKQTGKFVCEFVFSLFFFLVLLLFFLCSFIFRS